MVQREPEKKLHHIHIVILPFHQGVKDQAMNDVDDEQEGPKNTTTTTTLHPFKRSEV